MKDTIQYIKETEEELRKISQMEVAEHKRHRDRMVRLRAIRESLGCRLSWLDELKRNGQLEVA